MATAIIIDPVDRSIRETDIQSYKDMLAYVPGGITVAYVFHDAGDVLYVDDEALLSPPSGAFRWKLRLDGQPMMSRGIITGPDGWIGLKEVTLDTTLSPEQVAPFVEWLSLDEAFQWFEDRKSETSAYIEQDGVVTPVSLWGEYLKMMRGN